MSWLPDELQNLTQEQKDGVLEAAGDDKVDFECKDKSRCTGGGKYNRIKALLLVDADYYGDKTREEFVDRFLGKLADLCVGNFGDNSNTSPEFYESEWYKYVSTHQSEFCLDAKYSSMLYDESKPLIDVMMMIPWKYYEAYGV
jgi:hypothetical protein